MRWHNCFIEALLLSKLTVAFPPLPTGLPKLPISLPLPTSIPFIPPLRPGHTFTVGQPIKTTSGTVHGTHAVNNTDVSLYAGIPFAQPPIGSLRWMSPQPFKGTADINATAFGADCASNSIASGKSGLSLIPALGELAGPTAVNNLLAAGSSGNTHSEDCLTLNVWTRPQVGERRKAVLVWIYGGGFQFGATNSKEYNGEFFVKNQDVVFVSINYRTNVFGFPGLPVEGASQNPGLEDQRLAIEWIRDNIANFGGDPERITIFGESAGGASVDYYAYAYVDDPIIAGSISESGSARSFFDPPRLNNTAAWYNFSQALGCGDESVGAEASITCLRGKSTDNVLNATVIDDPLKAILGNFGPTADGKTVFQDYVARGQAGNFIKKPYLTGNNNYEAGIFKFLAFNVQPPISDNQWDVFDLEIFTCPTADAAQVRASHNVPVWRYRFFGEFPNVRLTANPNSGAYHTGEISTLFETAETLSGAADTPPELAISMWMNKAWADFAKDPERAFTRIYDFPMYSPDFASLIEIGVDNKTLPQVVFPNNTDASCSFIQRLVGAVGGVNALTGDPEGFSHNFGVAADQLTGLVGIGQDNNPGEPEGPPAIAGPVSPSAAAVESQLEGILPTQTPTPAKVKKEVSAYDEDKWKRIAEEIREWTPA